MREQYLQERLYQITPLIDKAKGNQNIGIVLMVVSIFILWPLLIVGLIITISANGEISKLEEEKKQIELELQILRQQYSKDSL